MSGQQSAKSMSFKCSSVSMPVWIKTECATRSLSVGGKVELQSAELKTAVLHVVLPLDAGPWHHNTRLRWMQQSSSLAELQANSCNSSFTLIKPVKGCWTPVGKNGRFVQLFSPVHLSQVYPTMLVDARSAVFLKWLAFSFWCGKKYVLLWSS